MTPDDRILLILDLDETLVRTSETRVRRACDFRVGPYFVYARPHLADFLRSCAEAFQIAVWSASSADYLNAVLHSILPPEVSPRFVWNRERCVQRLDADWYRTYFVKDLKKVRRQGYDLKRVLIVDDTPRTAERNYGNAVYVRPYLGAPDDDELARLGPYLESLRDATDVRTIEKRGWRTRSPREE